MSDMTKTWMLRGFLYVAFLSIAALGVGFLDQIISRLLAPTWFGPSEYIVERIVCIGLIAWRLLGWLERRVWVGSRP